MPSYENMSIFLILPGRLYERTAWGDICDGGEECGLSLPAQIRQNCQVNRCCFLTKSHDFKRRLQMSSLYYRAINGPGCQMLLPLEGEEEGVYEFLWLMDCTYKELAEYFPHFFVIRIRVFIWMDPDP